MVNEIIKLGYVVLLSVAIIILAIWGFGYQENLPAPQLRNNQEFIAAIGKTHKELFTKTGQPIFKITKTIKPSDNWYILHLTSIKDRNLTSMVLVNDPHFGSKYMKVIIGPESKFARSQLVTKNIPGTVINTLRTEGNL